MGQPNKKTFSGRATVNGTDQSIFIAPWLNRKRYIPKKIWLTNEASTASTVKIYDYDGTVGAPTARGNNTTNPILEYIVPATSTVVIKEDQVPFEFFMNGFMLNASQTPLQAHVEIVED